MSFSHSLPSSIVTKTIEEFRYFFSYRTYLQRVKSYTKKHTRRDDLACCFVYVSTQIITFIAFSLRRTITVYVLNIFFPPNRSFVLTFEIKIRNTCFVFRGKRAVLPHVLFNTSTYERIPLTNSGAHEIFFF